MLDLSRNDLTITGNNVKLVLDFIGFDPLSPSHWDCNMPIPIDFSRIVPEPKDEPIEGRVEWRLNHWGTLSLFDGYSEGDVFELTTNKVSFKFYTTWAPAYNAIKTLARQFPDFRFRYRGWDMETNHMGEVIWEKGQPTVFAAKYCMKMMDNCDQPAFDPVTPDILSTAKSLVEQVYKQRDMMVSGDTGPIEVVSEAIAISGGSVKLLLNVVPNGGACLMVRVVDPKEEQIRQQFESILKGNAR